MRRKMMRRKKEKKKDIGEKNKKAVIKPRKRKISESVRDGDSSHGDEIINLVKTRSLAKKKKV